MKILLDFGSGVRFLGSLRDLEPERDRRPPRPRLRLRERLEERDPKKKDHIHSVIVNFLRGNQLRLSGQLRSWILWYISMPAFFSTFFAKLKAC